MTTLLTYIWLRDGRTVSLGTDRAAWDVMQGIADDWRRGRQGPVYVVAGSVTISFTFADIARINIPEWGA